MAHLRQKGQISLRVTALKKTTWGQMNSEEKEVLSNKFEAILVI